MGPVLTHLPPYARPFPHRSPSRLPPVSVHLPTGPSRTHPCVRLQFPLDEFRQRRGPSRRGPVNRGEGRSETGRAEVRRPLCKVTQPLNRNRVRRCDCPSRDPGRRASVSSHRPDLPLSAPQLRCTGVRRRLGSYSRWNPGRLIHPASSSRGRRYCGRKSPHPGPLLTEKGDLF